jgi:hypothetical protein
VELSADQGPPPYRGQGLIGCHALPACSARCDGVDRLMQYILDMNCDAVPGVAADGDGVPSIDSGGLDCDDLNPATEPAASESCGDGADNDCDGLVDEPECV